ncbi:MAG TPA: DUF4166 domain-containing protein [Aliidongia sp.]|nr:DUF4166 domain-containing protein [Aliidongia sp.]
MMARSSAPAAIAASPAIDFERLVGAFGWRRLPADIRRRFGHEPEPGHDIRYVGIMSRVDCSLAGLALAQLCRLIGTPFAPYRGADIPVDILLRATPSGDGIVWMRDYHYPGLDPIRVSSTKQAAGDGTLLECVAYGFGMRLEVFEADRILHFRSLGYFWQVWGRRVPLPDLLSPGRAHVIHQDLGRGRFRFAMTIRHPLLGMLFEQDGIFRDEGDRP